MKLFWGGLVLVLVAVMVGGPAGAVTTRTRLNVTSPAQLCVGGTIQAWVVEHIDEVVTTSAGGVRRERGTVTVTNVGYPPFHVPATGVSVSVPVDDTVTVSAAGDVDYAGRAVVHPRYTIWYLVGTGTTAGGFGFGFLGSHTGTLLDLCAATDTVVP